METLEGEESGVVSQRQSKWKGGPSERRLAKKKKQPNKLERWT